MKCWNSDLWWSAWCSTGRNWIFKWDLLIGFFHFDSERLPNNQEMLEIKCEKKCDFLAFLSSLPPLLLLCEMIQSMWYFGKVGSSLLGSGSQPQILSKPWSAGKAMSPALDQVTGMCVLSHFSSVWLYATLWTVAHQAALTMGFSNQEYWSRSPYPPPGDLPDPGIEPVSLTSLALAGRFFTFSVTNMIRHNLCSCCYLEVQQEDRQ